MILLFFNGQITSGLSVLERWEQTGVFPESLTQFTDRGEDITEEDITVFFKYFYNCPKRERPDTFWGLEQGLLYREFCSPEVFVSKAVFCDFSAILTVLKWTQCLKFSFQTHIWLVSYELVYNLLSKKKKKKPPPEVAHLRWKCVSYRGSHYEGSPLCSGSPPLFDRWKDAIYFPFPWSKVWFCNLLWPVKCEQK